jgi:desulfoferrodoxin-like iron-binding protein
MSVTKTGERFYCTVCGNEVMVTKMGGGTLVCCGKEMASFAKATEGLLLESSENAVGSNDAGSSSTDNVAGDTGAVAGDEQPGNLGL